MTLYKLLHLLSVVVWVGGMFFAYMVLRPCAADVLPPPERLRLWDKVLARFFNWVWGAVYLLFSSGLYMIYQYGGLGAVPHYLHLMLMLGLVMFAIFAYVFFSAYVRLNLAVANKEWEKAAAALATVRKLVALNLSLGVLTILLGVGRGF